jgi:hypothetical protein
MNTWRMLMNDGVMEQLELPLETEQLELPLEDK